MTTRGVVQSAYGVVLRSLAAVTVAMMAFVQLAIPVAADEAAIQFVQRMTRELIAANRSGSILAFSEAMQRNAHVGPIGNYALGSHQAKLPQADRDTYLKGMVRFISRYAASESQKYHVSHVQITGPARRVNAGVMVDTKVVLRDGASYDVQWLLQSSGGGYKVRDAKVSVLLGEYWMTPFLKDLFEKYIAENGSVQALVVALNR
jgi:phospholipid transport system substrate-binding protein